MHDDDSNHINRHLGHRNGDGDGNRSSPAAADWSFPTRVRIGPGRVADLAAACAEAGTTRPLVVTDVGLAGSAPITAVTGALRSAAHDHALFAGVRADPTEDDVSVGSAVFAEHGCDGVVVVGGGSAIDVGKLIAVLAHHDGPVWDLEDGVGAVHAGLARLGGPPAPVVAIPTTAGTGSEVGRASVLTDTSSGVARKRVVFHPAMLPAGVICDPELTVGLPRHLTAGTGMDAFSHALEAYCSPVYHPAADGIAIEAIRLVFEHLPVAFEFPTHLDARQQMLAAALLAATSFQKGLGAMHALAHPIGAIAGTHHGTTNAVLMPYVLLANRRAIEPKIGRLADAAGITGGFDGFVDRVLDLRRRVGIPDTLADLGVHADALDAVAAAAPLDPSAPTNPVPVSREYAYAVATAAFAGVSSEPEPA